MPSSKWSDRAYSDHRLNALSHQAFRLLFKAVNWSTHHLTDGQIPNEALRSFSGSLRTRRIRISTATEELRQSVFLVPADGLSISELAEVVGAKSDEVVTFISGTPAVELFPVEPQEILSAGYGRATGGLRAPPAVDSPTPVVWAIQGYLKHNESRHRVLRRREEWTRRQKDSRSRRDAKPCHGVPTTSRTREISLSEGRTTSSTGRAETPWKAQNGLPDRPESYDARRASDLFESLGLQAGQVFTICAMPVTDSALHTAARDCLDEGARVKDAGKWIYAVLKKEEAN